MSIVVYSPEDVVILIGGVYRVEGLIEGSFISISEPEVKWKTSVTADGRVTRTQVNHPIHEVTISTLSTADVNNVFTAWCAADSKLFGVMLPLFIKDAMGSTMFYAPLSWIEQVPTTDFDIDAGQRDWVLKTAGATHISGGNGNDVADTSLVSLGFLAADFGGLF